MTHNNRKLGVIMIAFFILCSIIANAQDIIVKNDKTEIKGKVTEISETLIKYKKWDNLDGPIYNIFKNEVFMIVYANGHRETIKQSNAENHAIQNQTDLTNTNSTSRSSLEDELKPSKVSKIDTTVDYKNIKIKYKPSRLIFGLQSPTTLGTEQEFRLLKNTLNVGVAYYYSFPKDTYILQSNFAFIYASLYAPINRLTGNYEKQDKGLFLFGQVGYGLTSVTVEENDGSSSTISSGKFTWRIGADYYFSKGIGLSFSSYEFNSFYGGLVISIL